ncbi:serine/threonine-protein kinase [Actinomadura sp. 6K520]|uniref:serine/threonine-protein kinase n=1 Tax=Actinomadura sp. 6K520 TaxID=2530364 RepID=UPI001052C788|nr:serine/threonine-protein kinase [Actinomadura sp. 6K520]TDE30667.1 serine/threonine protein kinase [Actinomadura sp. 6K520]
MTSREHRLPGFIELAELGTGAQGEVVLARHESGGGPVAIKYLAPGMLGDTAARNTFRAEAQMLKRVTSPHVARLLDYLESPWAAAIVLEAVAGRPLRKVLDEHRGALTPEAALTTLKGSLLGLAAAHAAGVVHRDYKPANVLVQDDGQSKLIDFGVAVLTGRSGDISGTPAYMAPEQWAGAPATPATDLYAATCVFVECISGEKPFRGTTLDALKADHTNAPPPLDRVPEVLRPLVERGMAKSPADRIWDAHQFVNELETIAVRTYGPDWERRGLLALGAIAATVATAIPLAMLGGALLAPGASATAAGTIGSGAVGYAQGAATADFLGKTGTTATKGFLAKVGGTKGAAGIGAAGVGAVIAAWVLWPSGPGVGGESRGGIHAYFTRPGALTGQPHMPASDTPYMDLLMTVTPARVKPGTNLRLVEQFRARTPAGAKYLPGGRRQCFGEDAKRDDVVNQYGFGWYESDAPSDDSDKAFLAFYRVPPAKPKELPTGPGAVFVQAESKKTDESQPYVAADCAFQSKWTQTFTLRVPGPDVLTPGTYLVSTFAPMQITGKREGVSQEAMGTVNEGSAPVIEVLED